MACDYKKLLMSLAFLNVFFHSGCQLTMQERGFLEKSGAEIQLSSKQLRVLVNDFTLRYVTHIEQTCDRVLSKSPSVDVRRNALLWKINGINATFRAASRDDPMGAFLDLWILVKQTDDLLVRKGSMLFGSASLATLNQGEAFENRLRTIQATIGREIPKLNKVTELGEPFAEKFANKFPIEDLYFDRESAKSHYIDAVQANLNEPIEVLGRLEVNIDELQGLLRLYAEFLPKQARWEAELLTLDVIEMEPFTESLADLKQTTVAAESISQTVAQLPGLIDQERQAVEFAIDDQRKKTVQQIEAMRVNTIVQLQEERRLVLETVNQERVLATEDLKPQLDKTISSIDDLSKKRTEEAARYGESLLVLAINETKQTLAIASVFVGFFILFAGWLFTRKPKAAPPNLVNYYSPQTARTEDDFFKQAS